MKSTASRSSVNNVLKKLSAVRVTLPAEEQAVLDMIVTGLTAEDEVEGHAMKEKAASGRVATRVATRASSSVRPAEDEVEGHAMKEKAASGRVATRVATRASSSARPDDDEVEGHAMTQKAASGRAATRVATKAISTIRVVLNQETGQYTQE